MILEQLTFMGFKIIDRNPSIVHKEKRTIMVPVPSIDKKCECGNDLVMPQFTKKKLCMIDVTYFYHDRVILEI